MVPKTLGYSRLTSFWRYPQMFLLILLEADQLYRVWLILWTVKAGLISLCLYKENNKLRD
jgi:hypothetical protein